MLRGHSPFGRALGLFVGLHGALALATPAYAQSPAPYRPAPAQTYSPDQPTTAQAPPPPPTAAPAVPAPGATSAGGGDVIYLKNGGLLRGTLIDAIPGAHARIQLATGEVATVQWADIGRIEHLTHPPPPSPTTTAPTTTAPTATAPTSQLHIEAPRPVTLQGRAVGAPGEKRDESSWVDICDSPCDRAVPATWEYRITGGGVKQSRIFTLTGQPGQRVVVTVDPASKAWFVLGIVGTSLGGLTALIGLLVVAVGSICGDATVGNTSSTDTTCSGSDDVKRAGWTVTAVGLGIMVGGIVAIATNSRTGVDQGPADPRARPDDAWRQPMWREPTAFDRALPPVGVSVPIFSTHF